MHPMAGPQPGATETRAKGFVEGEVGGSSTFKKQRT